MAEVPEHTRVIASVAASVTGRLGTGEASRWPCLDLGWSRLLRMAALCGWPLSVMWLTRRVDAALRARAVVTTEMLDQRYHGNLTRIRDSERRLLRPIGTTAYDVAVRTGVLLADLAAISGVRIFLGAHPVGTDLPPVPHTICAGRRVIVVESVAWPSGSYEVRADGRIHCNGVYTGQSTNVLSATARTWRKVLPRRHDVVAVVVVHPISGKVRLPTGFRPEPVWVLADDAMHRIEGLVGSRRAVNRNTIAALVAGSADVTPDPA